jgi:hypothetical protein
MQVRGTHTCQVMRILDAASKGVDAACKFQECADAHGLVSYAKCIETSGGSLEDGFLHLTDSQSRSASRVHRALPVLSSSLARCTSHVWICNQRNLPKTISEPNHAAMYQDPVRDGLRYRVVRWQACEQVSRPRYGTHVESAGSHVRSQCQSSELAAWLISELHSARGHRELGASAQ